METHQITHRELNRIFDAGFAAYGRGEPQGFVPYDWAADLERHEEWLCGWLSARDAVNDVAESVEGAARDMTYVGGGYARDSRGNYREAFWAGTP